MVSPNVPPLDLLGSLLLEPISANTRAMQSLEQRLASFEAQLAKSALATAGPVVTSEALVKAHISTATVGVDVEITPDLEFTDLKNKRAQFEHLSITDVAIAASQLANADDVRVRIFRHPLRRVPLDLVVEFTGSSLVAGTWQASFNNRRIEYTDLADESKLYLAIRNTLGNTVSSTFDLWIYARVFPTSPPS